jgi:hypothetical protein
MRKLTILVALVALGLVAVVGVAYAVDRNLGPGNDLFIEREDGDECFNDSINGGTGSDTLRFQRCPNNEEGEYEETPDEDEPVETDRDFGTGGRGADDKVNVADRDELDTAAGGRGRSDLCILGEDEKDTASEADDVRDDRGRGCEQVQVVEYDVEQE